MFGYGFSIQGKSHIERKVVCQDSSRYVALKGGWYLGVVADGVGSAIHSDIGSKLAVESVCEFLLKKMNLDMADTALEELLQKGYLYALGKITEFVKKKEDMLEQYDTTLSVALFNGEKVIYGHAGDGGILVRQWDGEIRPITKRQKGADGTSVRPLRAGKESWEFGIYDKKTAAVLLATDGMLDGVFQPVLVNLPSNRMELAKGDFRKDHAYITAAEFFMNPDGVYRNQKITGGDKNEKKNNRSFKKEQLKKKISKADAFYQRILTGNLGKQEEKFFLDCMEVNYQKLLGAQAGKRICQGIAKYCYVLWAVKHVEDDKSVVCLMNEKAKVVPQEEIYYMELDFKWRQECYQALLYNQELPPVPKDDPEYYKQGTSGGTSQNKNDNLKKKKSSKLLLKHKEKIGLYEKHRVIHNVFFCVMIMALFSGVFCFIGKFFLNKNRNLKDTVRTEKQGTTESGMKSSQESGQKKEMESMNPVNTPDIVLRKPITEKDKIHQSAKRFYILFGNLKLEKVSRQTKRILQDRGIKNLFLKRDVETDMESLQIEEDHSTDYIEPEFTPMSENEKITEEEQKVIDVLNEIDNNQWDDFFNEVREIYEKEKQKMENEDIKRKKNRVLRRFERNMEELCREE